jgi:hypothetical protein
MICKLMGKIFGMKKQGLRKTRMRMFNLGIEFRLY